MIQIQMQPSCREVCSPVYRTMASEGGGRGGPSAVDRSWPIAPPAAAILGHMSPPLRRQTSWVRPSVTLRYLCVGGDASYPEHEGGRWRDLACHVGGQARARGAEPKGEVLPRQAGPRDQVAYLARDLVAPDDQAVGFQKSATDPDLGFYAVRSYSLTRPPRTGPRLIRSWQRSATGWSGHGGRSWRLR